MRYPYLIGTSIRGDVTHARQPDSRMAYCGTVNIGILDEPFDPDSVYACKKCLKKMGLGKPAPPTITVPRAVLEKALRECWDEALEYGMRGACRVQYRDKHVARILAELEQA